MLDDEPQVREMRRDSLNVLRVFLVAVVHLLQCFTHNVRHMRVGFTPRVRLQQQVHLNSGRLGIFLRGHVDGM
jgi:hypothetical protein